jgi:NTP pyrophosphatase (non-canonical NTP hydrolase)
MTSADKLEGEKDLPAHVDNRPHGPESQADIAAWGEATFGPAANPADLVRRARQELDELVTAVEAGDVAEASLEMADVMILLYRLAQDMGCDLNDSVTQKMAINRARKWTRAGDGTGRHVETP